MELLGVVSGWGDGVEVPGATTVWTGVPSGRVVPGDALLSGTRQVVIGVGGGQLGIAVACDTELTIRVPSFRWNDGDGTEGGCVAPRTGEAPGDSSESMSISWVTPVSRDVPMVTARVAVGVSWIGVWGG